MNLVKRFWRSQESAVHQGEDDLKTNQKCPTAINNWLAIYGAHLKGFPLHKRLTDAKANLVSKTNTAKCYRLYTVDGSPPNCILVRDENTGRKINLELYSLEPEIIEQFDNTVCHGFSLGKIELENGAWGHGRVASVADIVAGLEITNYGGWNNYLSATYSFYT